MLSASVLILSACISQPLAPQEQATDTGPANAEGLHVAPSTVWLSEGASRQLSAWLDDPEIAPDSVDLVFSTTNPGVVAVSEDDGLLSAVGPGSARVSVTARVRGRDGATYRADDVAVTVTDDAQEAVIGRLLGVPNLESQWSGLAFTPQYDAIFEEWGETHWERSGGSWQQTYYDRGLAWYAAWWRTGDARYMERAAMDITAYRDEYLLPNNGAVPPRWANPEGLALHYLITGDETSAEAVALLADKLAASWMDNMLTTQYQDGRIQGRTVLASLVAWEIDAPARRDWSAEVRRGVDNLIEWYEASGGTGLWEMKSYCNGQANFQVAHAVLEALIRYYDLVEQDPRIPPIVKESLDYMWNWWNDSAEALSYLTVSCDNGSTGPAADLNLLSVPPFGWYYAFSGDETYRSRGDALFQGGLEHTFWSGDKQFNQSFMRSWRYPYYTQ